MDAYTFIQKFGREEAERVAEAAGTNWPYFYQIALGHRRPSVKLAEKLEEHSAGRLDFASLLRSRRKGAA